MAALLLVISDKEVSIWVRLADWVLDDGELPRPVPGSVLSHMGIRVHGTVEAVGDAAGDALIAEARPSGDDPRAPIYVLTGQVEASKDVGTDDGSGARPAGLELVLHVGACSFQAQVDGHARDVERGSRVCVRGTFFVVPEYEWDDFGLVDTRSDWTIEEVLNQPDGDFLLLVTPSGD